MAPSRVEASGGREGAGVGTRLRFAAVIPAGLCRQSVTEAVLPGGRVCGARCWRAAAAPEVEVGPYCGREPQREKTLTRGMKAEILNESKLNY